MLSSEHIYHPTKGKQQLGNLDKEFSNAIEGMNW